MCIVLHQFAELNDNHPFTQVQNCPKFGKNEMSIQRVEVIPLSLPSLSVCGPIHNIKLAKPHNHLTWSFEYNGFAQFVSHIISGHTLIPLLEVCFLSITTRQILYLLQGQRVTRDLFTFKQHQNPNWKTVKVKRIHYTLCEKSAGPWKWTLIKDEC